MKKENKITALDWEKRPTLEELNREIIRLTLKNNDR